MKTTYLTKTTCLTVATLALLALAVPSSSRAEVQVQVEDQSGDYLGKEAGCIGGVGELEGPVVPDGNIPITGNPIFCPDGYVEPFTIKDPGPVSTIGGVPNDPNRTGTWIHR